MTEGEHRYQTFVRWTGNRGSGTGSYRGYDRDFELSAPRKPTVEGSAAPAFHGDPSRWNPEEMLVASLSACHQLWYLHMCAEADVVVTGYEDAAEGYMSETRAGGGRFLRVVLRPKVTITSGSDASLAERLHGEAAAKCFIANSVMFPVDHEPEILVED